MHFKINHGLMAQVALGAVFKVKSILVSFHVSLPRKDFVANVAGELAALALVYL